MMTGNRCGFQLATPRYLSQFFPNTIVSDIQKRSTAFFEERSGSMYIGRRRMRNKHRGEFHERSPRGERAESIARLVATMAARLNFKTLRLVDYRTGKNISVERWARLAGLSIDRTKGAIHDLSSCGYLGGYQEREEKLDGRFVAHVSTRWFTRQLLERFGVWERLRPPPKRAASRPFKTLPEPEPDDPEKRGLEFEIGRANPDWSPEAVAAAAAAELAARRPLPSRLLS
jgi:hypothetical protein